MDETEGGSRYLSNYGANQGYGSTRPKFSGHNLHQPHSQLIAESYVDEDDEVEEDEEEANNGDGEGEMNGLVRQNGDYVDNDDGDDDTDTDNDNNNNNNNNDDGNDDDDDDDDGEGYKRSDGFNMYKHPKKRKLKSLLSSFELAPRVPPLPPPPQVAQKASGVKPGGRNALTDWSEHETFILLDAWGERFVKRGRKSLRSEEWQEVAEKVSQGSKLERTDTQCRNRLDTLKKKYKKEKALLEQNRTSNTKWVYFKKMNMLMEATPTQQAGLLRGVDSREFGFMNSSSFLNHANGLDEMRNSPGDTNSQDGDDDDDSDLSPPKKSKYKGEKVNGGSFKLLADSINKFCEIYEKIENGKRKQMVELEKMRMDFYKDLELQKRQILDRARGEIAKIRQGDHEE